MRAASNSALGSATRTLPKSLGDASAGLRELAEPWPSGSYAKQAVDRAAKRAGLKYWRAFDLWYRKARRVEDYELEAIASAIDKKRREAARNELHNLKTRIALLEARLAQADSEFHRETTDSFWQGAGVAR
jgi:hypothetical protein